MRSLFEIEIGESPILATAIHDGHSLRPELQRIMRLSDEERLREEDPYTGIWTKISSSRIQVHPSRFEVDLNRPRTEAVYASPRDAWGLSLWKEPYTAAMKRRSLAIYDRFYMMLAAILDDLCFSQGGFVVLDLHSYNHRRNGPSTPVADPNTHPDINIGTGSVPMPRYRHLVNRFQNTLRSSNILDGDLDVRENINFRGRHLAAWVHERYGRLGCVLAIEVKKFFMDEWTGVMDREMHQRIMNALQQTIPILEEEISHEPGSPLLDRLQQTARG